MFYIVFALVILAIGGISIDPLVAWLEDRSWTGLPLSLVMMTALGVIPAIIVGAGIIGDTVWRGDRK